MRCSEIRDLLSASRFGGEPPRRSPGRPEGEIAAHCASCPECARYAARLEHARAVLSRESDVSPGPGFARRVVARLPSSAQVLGWAALRMLPAAIALALAIGAFGLFQTPSAESSLMADDTSSEALFTYAAMPPEGGGLSAPVPAPVAPQAPGAAAASPAPLGTSPELR